MVAQEKQKTAYGYKWTYCVTNEPNYENEKWSDIPPELVKGATGYQVSNCGRIKNRTGRFTKRTTHISGYVRVNISCSSYLLHRLVAQVFKPPTYNAKDQVNHINGNKQNNHASNLEWCTNKENIQHAFDTGLIIPSQKKVVQYDLLMNKIGEFKSQTEASRQLNIGQTSISRCCSGKLTKAGGFKFRFAINVQ